MDSLERWLSLSLLCLLTLSNVMRWVGRLDADQAAHLKDLNALRESLMAHFEIRLQEVVRETRHQLRNEIQAAKSEHFLNLEERVKRLESRRER